MIEKTYTVTFWRSAKETELPINRDVVRAWSAAEAIRRATNCLSGWDGDVDHVTVRPAE